MGLGNGYDWSCGMSVNAVDAYDRGLLPASKIARKIGRGVTAADVAAVLNPAEWHHTSARFNKTNFYKPPTEDEIERILALAERRKNYEEVPRVTRVTMWVWQPDIGRNNKKIWRKTKSDLGLCKVYGGFCGSDDFIIVETEDGQRIRRKRRYFLLEDEDE